MHLIHHSAHAQELFPVCSLCRSLLFELLLFSFLYIAQTLFGLSSASFCGHSRWLLSRRLQVRSQPIGACKWSLAASAAPGFGVDKTVAAVVAINLCKYKLHINLLKWIYLPYESFHLKASEFGNVHSNRTSFLCRLLFKPILFVMYYY